MSTLISIYGLIFDPSSVTAHLNLLADLVPTPAYALISDRAIQLVEEPARKLSLTVLVGIGLTLWSASTATKAVLSALNVAYGMLESRGLLRFQMTGLWLTLLAVVGAVLAISAVVLIPAAIAFIGLGRFALALVHGLSMGLVVCFFALAVAALYRYGPNRPPHRSPHRPAAIMPGTAGATVLWLLTSAGLSFYISHLGSFGATYGSIGAVVGVMLWFYVSAYAVLFGAELNAQLDARPVVKSVAV